MSDSYVTLLAAQLADRAEHDPALNAVLAAVDLDGTSSAPAPEDAGADGAVPGGGHRPYGSQQDAGRAPVTRAGRC